MDSLTDEENNVVDELKRRTINDVTPKMLDDPSVFYRFCKARDFNIVDAETMLRKHIDWRKEMGINTILTDYKPAEVFIKYAPMSFMCFDKEGCAVRMHDSGRGDSKGVLNCATNKEVLKFAIYCCEQDIDMVIKQDGNGKKRWQLGKPILSPVYDFEDFTYAKAVHMKSLQLFSLFMKTFSDNYPEYLRTTTVINAPFYYTWMFNALKPVIPATVIQKVRIYGTEGWKEELLRNIDADVLPAYLGGNRTDPDGNPRCETFIRRGELIPKSYYMQKRQKTLSQQSNVKKLRVMPFSKEEITFEVIEENSYLEWEFETESRDINFSLFLKRDTPEGLKLVELIPKQRIDTTYEPENGCFKCEKVGYYKIVFDNSYSWIHSKEVFYRAGIRNQKNNEVFASS